MLENKIEENTSAVIQNKTEFINALRQNFASTVKKIYINSLKREVGFREIKVSEQKSLSRIMIDNENRKDIIYDAQCALINQVCLDEDFDIYELSEFDKLKLMIVLYQTNMFKNEIKFVCRECGTENKYKLNFQDTIDKLDAFDLTNKYYEFENSNWKINFTLNYPSVKRISNFYRSYAKKYRSTPKNQIESLNNTIDSDYINMFVKTAKIINKLTNDEQNIDFEQFTPSEVTEIFSVFPQEVVYVNDGIISYISKEFMQSLNDTFQKHKCGCCQTICNDAIDQSISSFL